MSSSKTFEKKKKRKKKDKKERDYFEFDNANVTVLDVAA